MAGETKHRIVLGALRTALRPLVGLSLRHSLKLMDFMELVKAVYLDAAEAELRKAGTEPNVSRLSVMTGVHRRDATRLYRDKSEPKPQGDLVTRILGQWKQSPQFSRNGKPRTLGVEGAESEFSELVRSVSADIAPYTVLHELERLGMVRRTAKGVSLRHIAYIPDAGNLKEGFRMMGEDVRDLIAAAEENISAKTTGTNLHLKTEFDNIPAADEPKIRRWLLEEGSRFHERVESFLARCDRDANPEIAAKGKPMRVCFGSFSFVEKTRETA